MLRDYPMLKLPPFFGGQMGVEGSDTPEGLRVHPSAIVVYVDASHPDASDNHDGTNPIHPCATLEGALGKCTAGRGDVVILADGHAENITAANLTLSVAGVRVIGIGTGETRPTFTYTAAAGSLVVSAANVYLENVLLKVGVDSVAIMVDVNADDFTMFNCELREGTALQFLVGIDINGGGANAADRCKIYGCKIVQVAAGGNSAILIGAVEDGIEIVGNFIWGDFADAGIQSGAIFTNARIEGNRVGNLQTGDHAIQLTAAATGFLSSNQLYADGAGTTLDPGSLFCFENFAVAAIDTAATAIP